MKSWIYFARYGVDGPIKIGRADDPRRRVMDLGVGTPAALILLGAMLSDQAVEEEGSLHESLRAHHVRGEWFEPEAALEKMRLLGNRLISAERICAVSLESFWSESKNLHIRATAEEVRHWRAAAEAQSKSLSAWMRDLVNVHVSEEEDEA